MRLPGGLANDGIVMVTPGLLSVGLHLTNINATLCIASPPPWHKLVF